MMRKWLWLGAIAAAIAFASGGCDNAQPVGPSQQEDGGAVSDDGGPGPGTEDGGVLEDGGAPEDGGVVEDGGEDGGLPGADAGEDGGLTGEDAGTDAGVTPQDLCADVAKKKCDFFIRCRSDANVNGENRPNDQVASAERAACEARETTLACEVVAKGWDKGRATVDQTKYAQCVDATYPANTCARDLNAVLEKCLGVPYLTAATANGGLCTSDQECQAGFCNVPGGAACGTCQAFVQDGQTCQRNEQCDPATSFCSGFGTKTCRAYTAIDANCFSDAECGPGNVCARSGTFSRVCKAGVALGGACTGGNLECARQPDPQVQNGELPKTICSVNTGSGTCVTVQSAVGGVCGTGERVALFSNVRGPICNETEFCASGLCTPRRTVGQPCTSSDQCVFGAYCTQGGTCAAYLQQGAACTGTNPDRCQNFLSCQGATCQADTATVGEACNASVPCSEGYCDAASNTCTALKADGAACTAPNQCQSNACVSGTCAAACWQ